MSSAKKARNALQRSNDQKSANKKVDSPIYALGRELTPKGPITMVEQLDADNRTFWDDENRRFRKQSLEHPNEIEAAADLAARLIKLGHTTTIDVASETSVHGHARKLELLRKEAEQLRRRNGGKATAEANQRTNAKRDQRIHDEKEKGTGTKMIAGKEGLSESTINRILKKPRP